jgi:NAD(P)-dependent dehydrogenase (short-subunit alcohol dehydrogenase family)
MPDDISALDPRTLYPKPPFPEQTQQPPGHEAQMQPRPDHGETTYKGSGKLEGRKALITGGDSGIGRAVALAFAREGADVAISYLENEQDDAAATERIVTDAGRKCLLLPGDICQEQVCASLVERTQGELGGVDILVNNAGFQATHQNIEEIPTEEFDRIMKTNLYAMFWLTRAAVPLMKPGASIINTASVQAYQPDAPLVHYASTKAAIRAFTQAMAQQLGERGIRINAVAPGPVWTPLIPISFPAEKVSKFGSNTVFKRPAQPAEMAPIYVFLASAEASFVTGMVYGATGGEPTA